MKTTFKQQMNLIKSLRKAFDQDRTSYHYWQGLKSRQSKILNDVYSTLAALNFIGEDNLKALPQLIDLSTVLVKCYNAKNQQEREDANKAIQQLRKLLKSLK